MYDILTKFQSSLDANTAILLYLAVILVSGFLATRVTKLLHLPNVSGYIIAGILIGPNVLRIIPADTAAGMSFVSDIALAFIAFGVGKFFKKSVIMQTGVGIIVITVLEALVAGILVMLSMHFFFDLSWNFSMLLGAIATATAPASTMMTIKQFKAKGDFVNTLLQVVALDDVVCLLAFSVASSVVVANERGGFSVHDILLPIVYNIAAIAVGAFCGFLLSRILTPARSKDNRLILVIAMLLGISAACSYVDISPLLSCMVLSAVYINLTKDKKLYKQVDGFTPPIMSTFFIVSGMNLDITVLETVGVIGVTYFLVRILGKYLGAYFGCMIAGSEKRIRNLLGFALIPQAGVAIGLAVLGKRILGGETGNLLMTIILASSVLYELIGPACAKFALVRSGDITEKNLAKVYASKPSKKYKKKDGGKKSKKEKKKKLPEEDLPEEDGALPEAESGIPAEEAALK